MIVLPILLLASILMLFMNSGAEIAFFSLGYRELKNLRIRQYPASTRILQLLQEPRLLMSSMLVGNMVFRMLIILLCNYLVKDDMLPETTGFLLFLIRMLIAIVILVLFGELLPKVWAFYQEMFILLAA